MARIAADTGSTDCDFACRSSPAERISLVENGRRTWIAAKPESEGPYDSAVAEFRCIVVTAILTPGSAPRRSGGELADPLVSDP